MKPRPRTVLLSGLLAATAAAQQPAKIPAPPPAGADIKTAALAVPKVERPVLAPRDARMRPAPDKPTNPPPVDADQAPAPQLPATIMHDAVDDRLWTLGNTYKASFDREGATLLPYFADAEQNHPLTFTVRAASVAGDELVVRSAPPFRKDDTVTFDHGGLRAVYELRQRGVEQEFWFDALPLRGELRLDVAVTTDLRIERDGDGFAFTDARGRAGYSGAVVRDAAGHSLPLLMEYSGGTLTFRVPAAFVQAAKLPLCIDPLFSGTQDVYTTSNLHPAWMSDIAYEPSYGEYVVVYERQWSLVDRDVFARRYTFDMSSSVSQIIDVTTGDWSQPRVAANNVANRFLCVAKVSNGNVSPYWIGGRLLDAYTGLLHAPFDIERYGVPGHAFGDKINPDVGGDMDYYAPSYFAVVWERVLPGDHDVHMKLVDGNGNLVSAFPTYLDNSTAMDTYPRISKTDGTPPYGTMCWGVVWERSYSPTDQDIYGAQVRWDGAVTVPTRAIDTSSANTWRPTVSSPLDAATNYRNYLITYEKDVGGGSTDIVGTIMEQNGFLMGTWNLSQNVNGTWPQYAPTVDSDGARFVVGWTQLYGGSGNDYDTVLTTFGWGIGQGLVLQDVAYPGYSTDAEYDMSITGTHAAGSGAGRYGVSWTRYENSAPNGYHLEARLYDGVVAGGGFSRRSTACGTDADFQVFGAPLLGGWFHLSQTANTGLRGYLFGFPVSAPLGPCPACIVGVNGNSVIGSELQVDLPYDPGFIGLQVACQGFSFVTGPCLATVSLSDTLDIVIH